MHNNLPAFKCFLCACIEVQEELDWLKEASVLDATGNVTADASTLSLHDDDDVPDWLKD